MRKSSRLADRRQAHAPRRARRVDGAAERPKTLTRREGQDHRPLLERLLDTPHLPQIVPRLQPELLHRLIDRTGLEDCGELVELATPDQLSRLWDLDLWRAGKPGLDEQFDAGRFGVWLEVLMDRGAAVAVQKLVGMDAGLVVAGLVQHVGVFDLAAVAPHGVDDEEVERRRPANRPECEVGGYLVEARRTDSWDAIVSLLGFLHCEHFEYFHRVMSACRRLSNSGHEIDGLHDVLDDREQDMFDLAFAREQRREQQGYVVPAQARAFLQMAREVSLTGDALPPANPIARAYFRAIDWTPLSDARLRTESNGLPESSGSPPAVDDCAGSTAAVIEGLREAGVLPERPRALLDGPPDQAARLRRFHAHLRVVRESDDAAYSRRTHEFAYLANTIAAGCSIQARPFSEREAADAAAAVCNLGLENWPSRWLGAYAAMPENFLADHDLISVFQVGWKVLHGVGMFAAERLLCVLDDLPCDDAEIQSGLEALRLDLARHWQAGAPWRARDAMDVLAILDIPAWAAILGLIDQCPVIHSAMRARDSGARTVSATAFEFIEGNAQIASVRGFLAGLPEILRR